MARKEDFIKLLIKARQESSKDELFSSIANALGAEFVGPTGMQVRLTAPKSYNTSRMMEDAVRAAFNDKRKERYPDAMFNKEIPVEVKHRPDGFRDVPSDSYAVKDITDKWYVLLSGPVAADVPHNYDAFLLRSDHFRKIIDIFKKSSSKFDEADLPSINPDSPKAVEAIELAINDITKDLALAIMRKSSKKEFETEKGRPRMSLGQRVGVNRVRFDIKFESLLRNVISDILKD
jgi:hypothetical protein